MSISILVIVRPLNFNLFNRCVIVSYCALNFHFPNDQWYWAAFYVCLLALNISTLMKYLLKFLLMVVLGLCLIINIHILGLIFWYILWIFSHLLWIVFLFLSVSYKEKNFTFREATQYYSLTSGNKFLVFLIKP